MCTKPPKILYTYLVFVLVFLVLQVIFQLGHLSSETFVNGIFCSYALAIYIFLVQQWVDLYPVLVTMNVLLHCIIGDVVLVSRFPLGDMVTDVI